MNATRSDQNVIEEKPISRKILLLLFATLYFPYIYFHQSGYNSQIPASRLDLLHAIVTYQAIAIDPYHENTSNKALHKGHYYSDKAPGVVVVALPAFLAAAAMLDLIGISLDSENGWLASSWITCAGSIALVAALGGVGIFIWLHKWVHPFHAYVTTLALFLGALPFPYATFLMPHALVVGLLGLALWATGRDANRDLRPTRLPNVRDIAGGFFFGLAIASEYSAGVVVIAMIAYIVVRDFKRVLSLLIGMLPCLLLVPAYHWLCFGDPFTVAYHHNVVFTQMQEGFFGIKFPPNIANCFYLLFGSQQGLFYWSPVLLIAFAGYSKLHGVSRPLFWISIGALTIHILAISGYSYYSAGKLFGARLLAPTLLPLTLPTALGIARFPRFGFFLASLSIMITFLGTAIDAATPYSSRWAECYIPALVQGKFSYNLGSLLWLAPHVSLIPFPITLAFSIWTTARHFAKHSV